MKIKASLLAGLVASAPFAFAQDVEVATDPVGYVSVNLLAASDTRISVPMHRAPVFQGIPVSVDGSNINFAEGTGIQPENPAYFIAVRSGALAGTRATVVGVDNGGDTLVVESGVDLSGLATGEGGDAVQLIPHWTLATLFPGFPNETEIFVFDRGPDAGVNVAPSGIFTFFDGDWYDADFAISNDHTIMLDESFIVRDASGESFSAVIAGSVPMFPVRDPLSTVAADAQQDISIGFAVPAPIRLGDVLGAQDNDELFIPSNTEAGINKAPAEILTAFEGDWYDQDFNIANDRELEPGLGFVYRKAATPAPQTDVLVFTPSYLSND